jgi:glycosyltransferase involved in cell wall biosynthesis
MPENTARLGFVFIQVYSWEGGIQSYIRDVLRAYLSQEDAPPADVFLLRDSHRHAPSVKRDKLTFHYLDSPSAAISRTRLAASLVKHLMRGKYRHIFCGHSLLSPLVAPLCRLFGIPYTVIVYGKEVWTPLPPQQRRALQQATHIWANSRYSRDVSCLANGLDPNKFFMLPCIVDGSAFTPGQKQPELVTRYGLQSSRVLMTVARLWPGDIYKGVDVTIRALPKVLHFFPEVKYLVIGRGDDQPRLAQLAKDLGVSDRVVFAGFVPNEALVAHYRLADAYVMPSQEGFGIVYLEAMACGIPVLSGDNDGSADPLQDGRVGWRVPHRDPDAVAAACIEILNGKDPRCSGAWLRQETLAKFSFDSLKEKMGHLLKAL